MLAMTTVATTKSDEVGTVLRERYRIEAPVGEGGMGTVYLAEDLRLPGRRCALKCLRLPGGADDPTRQALRDRFLHEAALLARLDHPALPKVSDYFESDAAAWLVMDFVAGQDLRALLRDAQTRRRPLDEHQVLRWAEDVCSALTYLHGQAPPLVHRDIKPANLKLTPDGQIRLVDFGLAQPVDVADGRTVTVLTGAGSRPYQPIEQYGDGAGVGPRADVYALGATLYHLLTGHAPPSAQERFLGSGALELPRAFRPDLSLRTERAILVALALHPDARPASAEALRQLLVGSANLDAPADRPWAAALSADIGLAVLVAGLMLVALALTFW